MGGNPNLGHRLQKFWRAADHPSILREHYLLYYYILLIPTLFISSIYDHKIIKIDIKPPQYILRVRKG